MPVIDHDGASLNFEVAGSGPPVLLIMGLGYPMDAWWRVWPWLCEEFTGIRFDNRGVGRTGSDAAAPYTVERMATDGLAVLRAAGFNRAHVWGISMGGMIAQEIAIEQPDAVDRLILGCTHPGGPDAVFSDEVRALLANRSGLTPRQAAEVSVPYVYAPTTDPGRIKEDIEVRMAIPTSPEGYDGQLRGVALWQGSGQRLERISAPTLVMHGAQDRLVTAVNGHFIAERIPGAGWLEIPRASHIFWTDQPEVTQQAVTDFLGRDRSAAVR
ncbi:MAG: alpha/beta fold hydrolase [Actinomycetales bacterium]